jgi:archaellum component FlaC
VADLKQKLNTISTTDKMGGVACIDCERLKNETLDLKMKYDNLLSENQAFQSQLNLMDGQMKKLEDFRTRLDIVEDSMQDLFRSVNVSDENIRDLDHNISSILQ